LSLLIFCFKLEFRSFLVFPKLKIFFRHDQFLSSSELLQNGHSVGDNSTQMGVVSSPSKSSSSTDQLTNKYFGQILVKISSLLNLFELLDARTQSLVINWLLKLTSGISDQFRAVKEVFLIFKL